MCRFFELVLLNVCILEDLGQEGTNYSRDGAMHIMNISNWGNLPTTGIVFWRVGLL